MATTSTHLCFSPSLPLSLPSPSNPKNPQNFLTLKKRCGKIHQQQSSALGSDMVGDFGARDPYPAEIATNFGEKVFGNGNTEHKILIPNLSALSLSQQECIPISSSLIPLSYGDAQQLLRKVIGWRLVDDKGNLRLECLWKLRNFQSGVELVNRISKVAEAEGHYPNLHLEMPNQVRAQLWTSSIGGLCINDFIVAAKIDEIKTSDLVPKKRAWA